MSYWTRNEWIEDAKDRVLRNTKRADDYARELIFLYDEAAFNIEKEIEALFARFAKDNGLTEEAARQLLEGKEYSVWRKSIEEYIAEASGAAKDSKALLELNTLAMKSRITRKEQLLANVYPARGQRSYEDQLYLQRRNHGRSGEGRLYSCGGSPGHQLDHLPPHGPHRRIPHGQGADLRPGDLSEEAGLGDGLPQVPRPVGAGQQAGGHVGKHQAGQGWRWRLRGGLIMITLKRLNEVRQVASEERAAKLEKKGFTRIGGAAEEESRPVTKADLEKLGDALLDRLKAESKGGTKKGGKPKEEPDGSGTGEPDSGDGEK